VSPYVRPYSVRNGDRLAAWSVLLVLLAVYTATFAGLPDNPDAEVEFQTTSALARKGTPALGGTPEAEALREAGRDVVPGGPGREQQRFAPFGLGQAAVGLPFYFAGRALALAWPEFERRNAEPTPDGVVRSEYFAHLLVGWRDPLLGALTAFLLVLTARRLGMGRRAAWITAVTYGLATFAWPQARSTLSDVQAAFLLLAAFHFLCIAGEHFDRLRSPRLLDLAWLGACLGGAVLTRVAVLPQAAVLFAAALLVARRGRRRIARAFEGGSPPVRERPLLRLVALWLPVVACAAVLLWANAWRFGDPLNTGRGRTFSDPTCFSYPPHLGLLGLLVAPGKGLVWMAPGLLLLGWGLRRADGSKPWIWPSLLVWLALASFLPVALTPDWHGAPAFGPRYLLPFLPFAWLAFGFAVERGGRGLRLAAVALTLFGLLVQLPASLVDPATHQDLAAQAARIQWPAPPGAEPAPDGSAGREQEALRQHHVQWDWGFAAPWAQWRILRHRLAGLGEEFPVDEIFQVDSDRRIRAAGERSRGFRHLAWVDLAERLGGPGWPPALLCTLLMGAGIVFAVRALDRTRL